MKDAQLAATEKPQRTSRPTGKGRPSREQSAALTALILHVAAEKFLAEGFARVSMEAIAATVRVPKTTLYKRYPDKIALLDAILRDRVSAWSRITTPLTRNVGKDFRTRIIHHVAIILEWMTKTEVRAFTDLMRSAAGRAPGEVSTDFFGFIDMVAIISKEIELHGPSSGIRAKDPEAASRAIMCMISGWIQIHGIAGPLAPKAAKAAAEQIMDLLLRGSEAW
ncbi:TetR/AcrR family transcriptional regulator (plasmid) [Novosphingobium sp. BL-8A]|uniref:TetR/AcrR family transcriptional regulator n=1 Tax=Novosphingobium sp. BL-8A TaxID=3127639 RepID=UPI0037565DD8